MLKDSGWIIALKIQSQIDSKWNKLPPLLLAIIFVCRNVTLQECFVLITT